MDREEVIGQIDEILGSGEVLLGTADVTRRAAAIARLSPPRSVYAREAEAILEERAKPDYTAHHLGEILAGLREDIDHGYLVTVEREAREEVFDDLLGMATEINTRMHPAPAAVLAGAVLEEHLRRLAIANDINVFKSDGNPLPFDQLGIALVKAEIIKEPERKQATGYYALRTEGAHGHFKEVEKSDVTRAIEGVRDFMLRHPA